MTISEAIRERHSVRTYLDREIPQEVLDELQAEIEACNRESGLHIQLVTGEKNAFDGMMAHYGKFGGVQNYIAVVGKSGAALSETGGYYGEQIVLKAQTLGLNTCWVAMTVSKGTVKKHIRLEDGEKLLIVIALGYGSTQGTAHKSKTAEQVTEGAENAPDWFREGVAAALLAPTAMNQQKFKFIYESGKLTAKAGLGPYAKIDLGIVRYHFEIGSGKEHLFR